MVSPAITVEARYSWRVASVGLEATVGLPVRSPAGSGRMVTSRLLASAVPCLSSGAFFACAKASAGSLTVAGDGLDNAQTIGSFQAALGLRAGAVVPLASAFALRAYLEAAANLTRYTVRVGDEEVWRTPMLTGAAGLSGVFRF